MPDSNLQAAPATIGIGQGQVWAADGPPPECPTHGRMYATPDWAAPVSPDQPPATLWACKGFEGIDGCDYTTTQGWQHIGAVDSVTFGLEQP